MKEQETEYSIVRKREDWQEIPVASIGHSLWTENPGITAEGQLCYDEERLYVHMKAVEKEIRAVYTAPLSPVFLDSCLEFFFRLEGSGNYFNFEINPNGCLCVQYGPDRRDRINIVRNDEREYFDIRTGRTSEGWEVFYSIPLGFIRLFHPGYAFTGGLSANLYKCGDQTPHRHFLAWKPVQTPKPDFHRPEFFGRMRFEEERQKGNDRGR